MKTTFKINLFRLIFTSILLCNTLLQATLSFQTSVQSQAQGFATTAAANGLEAVHKNPAGLYTIKNTKISLMSASHHGDLYQSHEMALAHRYQNHIFALHLPSKSISDIPLQNSIYSTNIKFKDESSGLFLSYATKLTTLPFLLGLSTKFYQQKIHTQKAKALQINLGAQWVLNKLRLGLSIENLYGVKTWTHTKNETFKPIFHSGFQYTLNKTLTLLMDHSFDPSFKNISNIGFIIRPLEILHIYAGIPNITQKYKTFNGGFSLFHLPFTLHYLFQKNKLLGLGHRLKITYEL